MLAFVKMHGTGNDFIVFNGIGECLPDLSQLSKRVCDRHFGIGANGILVVLPSAVADVRMAYYNADGSVAPMCGNGIRCFARYVYENHIVSLTDFKVETLAGIVGVRLCVTDGKVEKVRANLGKPQFSTKDFPIATDLDSFLDQKITVAGATVRISLINMGTIHGVIFTDEVEAIDVGKLGPLIENHPLFPQRTNVNFCQVVDERTLKLITWERGAGLTLACGTGSCAAAVLSHMLKHTEKTVKVIVPGGELLIELIDKEVYLTGGADIICQGFYNDEGVL